MILAIERNTFNYLYKYNQLKINVTQFIDATIEDLSIKSKYKELLNQFDRALPIFEEDHELLLLEIDKNDLEFDGNIQIQYKAVKSIYPLTLMGKRLLIGKLNESITIQNPIFESLIEELKIKRSLDYRKLAVKKLHSAFGVKPSINTNDFSTIEGSVYNILKGLPQNTSQYIRELIDYNKTPSYIPDGNIEYLLKIGLIAIRSMGRDESVLEKGPYYKKSIEILKFINSGSLAESYKNFHSINDEEFRKSLNNILNQISTNYKGVDIFKLSYYYIAFKNILLKKDYNLLELGSAIKQLAKDDEVVASWVLSLIGYSFSFEKLYESLHKLDPDQLFKKPQTRVLEPPAKEVVQSTKTTYSKPNKIIEEKQSELFEENNKLDVVKSIQIKDEKAPSLDKSENVLPAIPENDDKNTLAISDKVPTTNQADLEPLIASTNDLEGVDIDPEESFSQNIDVANIDISQISKLIAAKKKNKKISEALTSFFDDRKHISMRDLTEFLEINRKNIDMDTIHVIQQTFGI